jgi:hypothetical protein
MVSSLSQVSTFWRVTPEEENQLACKPGSVPAVARRRQPFIWSGCCQPLRATYPGGWAGNSLAPLARHRTTPIRSCSRWGLPCHPRCRGRGALLPHLFTLAAPKPKGVGGRFVLCGTFPGVAPAGRYPAPYFRGARTFLHRSLSADAAAAARPTGAPGLGICKGPVNKPLQFPKQGPFERRCSRGPAT